MTWPPLSHAPAAFSGNNFSGGLVELASPLLHPLKNSTRYIFLLLISATISFIVLQSQYFTFCAIATGSYYEAL